MATVVYFVSWTATLRRTPAASRNARSCGFSFVSVALACDDVPENSALILDSGIPSTASTCASVVFFASMTFAAVQ